VTGDNHQMYALNDLLIITVRASLAAGEAILGVYESEFRVETKDDGSPLTLADQRSNAIIDSELAATGMPILSEEGKEIPFEERKHWEEFWLVDPLDGTKEFIHRRGEFTVNIALIEKGRPTLGVIYVPTQEWLYFGRVDLGAYRTRGPSASAAVNSPLSAEEAMSTLLNDSERLPIAETDPSMLHIIGSRSHATEQMQDFLEEKRRNGRAVEFVSAGSSLKFCRVAEGTADVYPRFGPTMEWDTAAGQAIAECAGAEVTEHPAETPLSYNKPDLHNPWFMVRRRARQ